MVEEFLDQGYAMDTLKKDGNKRLMVFFDGCYYRSGNVTTLDDIPIRNHPEKTQRELQDHCESIVKLKEEINIVFLNSKAKSSLLNRFEDLGYSIEEVESGPGGYAEVELKQYNKQVETSTSKQPR